MALLMIYPAVFILSFLHVLSFKRQYSQYNNLKEPKILHLSDLRFILYLSIALLIPITVKNSAIDGFCIFLYALFSLYLAIVIQTYKKHSFHLNLKTLHLTIINYQDIVTTDTDLKNELPTQIT